MIYNELCHKDTDWSKAIKQLLITLVAVVLGITAMSGYAKKELLDGKKLNPGEDKTGQQPNDWCYT